MLRIRKKCTDPDPDFQFEFLLFFYIKWTFYQYKSGSATLKICTAYFKYQGQNVIE